MSVGTDVTVTGDAVELELRGANLGARVVAFLIDALVQAVVLFAVIVVLFSKVNGASDSLIAAGIIASVVGTLVGLPAAVETLTHGRSLGKMALGLRVVRDDHGSIRMRQAVGRALFGFVELWSTGGAVAFTCAAFTKRGKRLGDLASGTLVVSERIPVVWPSAMPMPPRLARWAAGADIGTLDPRLTLAARQYLMRRHQLSSAAAQRVSTELADALRAKVAPQPPRSSADDLIMAILAERGRRDRQRLARNEQLRASLFG